MDCRLSHAIFMGYGRASMVWFLPTAPKKLGTLDCLGHAAFVVVRGTAGTETNLSDFGARSIANAVLASTTPVAGMPFAPWNRLTAASVRAPKSPSARMLWPAT